MPHKVMIVDDSAMMRIVVERMLKNHPEFKVATFAENGKKALEQLAQHPDLAIILLDIEMPEMNGLQFLQHAKLKSKARIIILSSVAVQGSPTAAKARELGADAIVAKPSGAVSLDLEEKRGAELIQIMKRLTH